MTATSFEHCCGVRFRAPMSLVGEASTVCAASQNAAAMERQVRMTRRRVKTEDVTALLYK